VLFGYAISGERTLEDFYERLQPWAGAFMALFGRDRLPARARPPANAPCRRPRIGLRQRGACVRRVPLATRGASEEKSSVPVPRSCKPIRTTEFAPALSPAHEEATDSPSPSQGYGKASVALPWKQGRFSGRDFALQPDGTLRCPAGQSLRANARRREVDGNLRIVSAASIRSCRPSPLREQCQWQGSATKKPRQVSVLLHPLAIGSQPLLWRDWSRRHQRRACMQLLRHQRVEVQIEPDLPTNPEVSPLPLSRASRAHYRLSWNERLARNVRAPTAGQVTIKLFGVPEGFATFLGLSTT
jgi:hypothetical protein